MNKKYTIYNKQITVNNATIRHNVVGDIELTEQEIRNLIKENPELLETNPTHKRKYFVPKNGKDYWYVDYYESKIVEDKNVGFEEDEFRISLGNCFATEQDAQDELNRRQALVRIWNNYDDKYLWDIDWKNNSKRFEISLDYDYKVFYTGEYTHSMIHNTELPYFKSAEDRNQFVKDNEIDLLTIFNIKK